MQTAPRLQITELPQYACEAILRAERFGRIAYSFRDRVDIQPIMYAYSDGWLFGRTSEGGKLETLKHNRWTAFEVDRVTDRWNWESVVLRGSIHFLGEDGDGTARPELEALARSALQEVAPESFGPDDPVPERSILFALYPSDIVGRRARLVAPD